MNDTHSCEHIFYNYVQVNQRSQSRVPINDPFLRPVHGQSGISKWCLDAQLPALVEFTLQMRAFAIECCKTHAGHLQDTLTRISLPSVLLSVRCGQLISSNKFPANSVQGCSYLAGCITPISCRQSSTSTEEWPCMVRRNLAVMTLLFFSNNCFMATSMITKAGHNRQ